jgi:hypothetical protein
MIKKKWQNSTVKHFISSVIIIIPHYDINVAILFSGINFIRSTHSQKARKSNNLKKRVFGKHKTKHDFQN